MSIWLPPKVSAELRAETEAHRNEILNAKRLHSILEHWNRELKTIDPYLEMAWFEDCHVLGVIPWRFHILRHNPGAPPSLIPIEGPDGGYVEPASQVYDILRAQDLWNAEANHDRKKRQQRLEDAKERQKAREELERLDEIRERLAAATRTQVSMNTASPWSQNFAGRRGVGR
jgi:hypothetical protein